MSDVLESLSGLVVPMAAEPLLLPNVAVAELVGYRLTQAALTGPEWFLGWTSWRGQQVPIIDPDRLLGDTAQSPHATPRTLILNAIGQRAGIEFIALRINAIPRSKRVLRGETVAAEGPVGDYVSQSVQLADEPRSMRIPDLLAIENALVEAGVLGASAT